ncbi:hypothetical protein, partial [Streptomyces chartreusis]|uniref:hypothetical protein n=1 Tax=Streptomyces chartreusis TaxID=1969 RepID=UPI003802AAFC
MFVKDARKELEKLYQHSPERVLEVVSWATMRVGAGHQWPVLMGEGDPQDVAREKLLEDFVQLVAYTYHMDGAEKATAMSQRLANAYGTQRRSGLVGAGRSGQRHGADSAGGAARGQGRVYQPGVLPVRQFESAALGEEDRQALARIDARGKLTDRALAWARARINRDHDGLPAMAPEPGPAQEQRRVLLEGMTRLVAHTLTLRGEEAAKAVSGRLVHAYGAVLSGTALPGLDGVTRGESVQDAGSSRSVAFFTSSDSGSGPGSRHWPASSGVQTVSPTSAPDGQGVPARPDGHGRRDRGVALLSKWARDSALPGKPRSFELRRVDEALAKAVGRDDVASWRQASLVLRQWKMGKADGRSDRSDAVEWLERRLREEIAEKTSSHWRAVPAGYTALEPDREKGTVLLGKWAADSALLGKRRSTELRRVDQALARAVKDDDIASWRHVLKTAEAWQAGKAGQRSARFPAVQWLQERVWAAIGAKTGIDWRAIPAGDYAFATQFARLLTADEVEVSSLLSHMSHWASKSTPYAPETLRDALSIVDGRSAQALVRDAVRAGRLPASASGQVLLALQRMTDPPTDTDTHQQQNTMSGVRDRWHGAREVNSLERAEQAEGLDALENSPDRGAPEAAALSGRGVALEPSASAGTSTAVVQSSRSLPAGFALGGRFGTGGRIDNVEGIVTALDGALGEAIQAAGYPAEIRDLALEHLNAVREGVGNQQWAVWLAQEGHEVRVESRDGAGFEVKAELVLPRPRVGGELVEVSGTKRGRLLGEGEEWGLTWDPEADQRYRSSRTSAVDWSGSLAVSHALAPLHFMTVTAGPSVGASTTRGRTQSHMSVAAGRRTMPTGEGVWFLHPGARLVVSVRPEGAKGTPAGTIVRPHPVTLGFPASMVPSWGGVGGAAAGVPVLGRTVLEAGDAPAQSVRDDAMWKSITYPEAIVGLEELQRDVMQRLAGRVARGSEAHLLLRHELGEANALRVFSQMAGLGYATTQIALGDGHWVAVGLRMHLRSVTRVEGGNIQHSETRRQFRHLDLPGESASRSLGVALAVPVTLGFSAGDGNYGAHATPLTLTAGAGRSQAIEVDYGLSLWAKLTTSGPTGVYQLGVAFVAEVRSDLPELAGEVTGDGQVYARVPLADAYSFETALAAPTDAAVADGKARDLLDDAAAEAVRQVLPAAIRDGYGNGPALVEMSGSVHQLQPLVMSLIEGGIADRGLAPLTAGEKHLLQRFLAVDFSLEGHRGQEYRLLSPSGLRRRMLLPNGRWATVVVKVTYDPQRPVAAGTRPDRSVNILRSSVYAVDDARSASRTVSLATGLAARFSLSWATAGRLGDVGFGSGYRYTRSVGEALGSTAFAVAEPGSETIEGPSAWVRYPAVLRAQVTIDGEVAARVPRSELGEGGPRVLRKSWRPAPDVRSQELPVDVTFWLPEQLMQPRVSPLASKVETSDDPLAFRENAGWERLEADDMLMMPLVPPQVAGELSGMLQRVTGIRPDDRHALVARFTDPGNLLTYLQRGTGNGSWQTEMLTQTHRWADAHVVVRMSIEVRKSVDVGGQEVRASRLALIEPTQIVTSGQQTSTGHFASTSLSLGVKAGASHAEALGAGGSYGAGHSSGTATQHRMIKGYLESSDPAGYQHRSAHIVYTIEVEHWRDTVFGAVRMGQLLDLRRIHVPSGLEFLRPVPQAATEEPPAQVPRTIPAARITALGPVRSLRFRQEDTSFQPPGHNPLAEKVAGMLRSREAWSGSQAGGSTEKLSPAQTHRLSRSLDLLLSPTALQAAIHRLTTTGVRLSPLGPDGPVLLLKGEPVEEFTYTESRSGLSVSTFTSSFTWAQEAHSRLLHQWSVSLGASGNTAISRGEVAGVADSFGYTRSGGRSQSASRLGGDSTFDGVTFQPGARLYEGLLRVSVTLLPTGQVLDPARHEAFATVDLVQQVSVPDAILMPDSDPQAMPVLPSGALALSPQAVRDRLVIPRDVADHAVRGLYESVRGQLTSSQGSPSLKSLLLTWGSTAEAAFADVMALAPQTFFSETLSEDGYTSPVLRRARLGRDIHGEVVLKARLFDAVPLGWVTVSHQIDVNRRTRLSSGSGNAQAAGLSAGSGVSETVPGTQTSSQFVGLARTVSAASQGNATTSRLVGLGDQRVRPEQRYLLVRASADYQVTLRAVHEQGALSHGAEEKTFHHQLDRAVELLIHPEAVRALTFSVPGQPSLRPLAPIAEIQELEEETTQTPVISGDDASEAFVGKEPDSMAAGGHDTETRAASPQPTSPLPSPAPAPSASGGLSGSGSGANGGTASHQNTPRTVNSLEQAWQAALNPKQGGADQQVPADPAEVADSLLGNYHRPDPDGPTHGQLRDRRLHQLGALITTDTGPVPPWLSDVNQATATAQAAGDGATTVTTTPSGVVIGPREAGLPEPAPWMPDRQTVHTLSPSPDAPLALVTADPTAPGTLKAADAWLAGLAGRVSQVDFVLASPRADGFTGSAPNPQPGSGDQAFQRLADTHGVKLRVADGAWTPDGRGGLRPSDPESRTANHSGPTYTEYSPARPGPERAPLTASVEPIASPSPTTSPDPQGEPSTAVAPVLTDSGALPADEALLPPPGGAWSHGDPVNAAPVVRSIGIPKAGLPYLSDLVSSVRSQVEAVGHTVSDQVWEALPQRLLSNYRYLVGDLQAPSGMWGLQVPLGSAEVLVSLDPASPRLVRDPSTALTGDQAPSSAPDDGAFHASQTTNSAYATGAHAQTQSGQTGATRGGLSATVGVGLPSSVAQIARVGGGISGTANQSNRTTTRVVDAEAGHIEDDRGKATLLSYEPNWSFRIRTTPDQHWAMAATHSLPDPGTERLLLWVPEHYLGRTRPEQVTADGIGDRAKRLPDTYFASGFTGLPTLFDNLVTKLQSQGLDLPIGSSTRNELLQKLWNLDAHLDEAVNDARGYTFLLHGPYGRPTAAVAVHTRRLDAAERVGETSDKAHVENVRTAIDGFSGGHTITNSSTVTPLSASIDIEPVPGKELGVAPTVYASATWTNTDGLSAGRNALNVVVPRYTGFTGGYQIDFQHQAKVSVRGRDTAVDTEPVKDRALVRLPEPDAFAHGFPVDRDALKADPGSLDRVPFAEDAVRGTGRGPEDPDTKPVPAHIAKGKGIGMGLVRVEQETVDGLLGWLRRELTPRGFLPPTQEHPFGSRSWWQHGNELDSRLDNEALLVKLVSRRGVESHYDQIHQDGMTFTLRHRRGFAGMDLDMDSARITLTARKSKAAPPRFVRSTDEYHTVNLAMGMAIAGMSTEGGKKLATGVRFRALCERLRAGAFGIEVRRSVGASQSVTFLNNRPELLEYPGRVDEFELTSDYQVKIEYQHSGMQGWVRPGVRDPKPFILEGQSAQAIVMPLGNEDGPVSGEPTPRDVLDQAVVYYLDTTGAREAATAALEELTGPAGAADQELNTFAGTIAMRSHLKEILPGAYTSDQPFRPRLFRDTFGAVDIRGKMGPSQYVGATDDKFVLGVIKLWLAQAGTAHTSSSGLAWTQVDALLGNGAGAVTLAGGVNAARGWGRSTTDSQVTTGGKELIQLDFNRVYAYRTEVDFTFTSRVEKRGKLALTGTRGESRSLDGGREMIYLVPEPEALHHYAQGTLPIPHHKLADVLRRWEGGELKLTGSTVAGVLTRWTLEAAGLSEAAATDRLALARTLADLHDIGALPVLDSGARDRFTKLFGQRLDDPARRRDELTLPEYLTRKDAGGVLLGHSGVHSLTYDSGKSTFDVVREQIDRIAPGLLASEPELWTGNGGPKRRIGRLQGGAGALQSLLAPGRDQAMLEDLISLNGHSFYLVNPVGWLLTDIVEVRLATTVEPSPKVHDPYAETGLENYGHGYASHSKATRQDGSQGIGLTALAAEGHGAGSGALGVAEGHHRGTTRGDVAVTEQTVYDWTGHYRVEFPQTLSVTVRRLDMAGRPLNNLLTDWYRRLWQLDGEHTVSEPGTLVLQVPRGLAEARPYAGPSPVRGFTPLPPLPGDGYVTGVLLDDALPAARRLLADMFGPDADSPTVRSSLVLPALLSRSHLTNHLIEATAGKRYQVADNVFIPGHSSDRARLWLRGDLFDLQVIAPVEGTGTGRYTKHQSGTTVNSTSDQRLTPGVTPSGNGQLYPGLASTDQQQPTPGTAPSDTGHHPPASVPPPITTGGSSPLNQVTSTGQASAGTENYRREQHIKQQGAVYLVRMRGRYRLEAERFHHHLFRDPSPRGTYRSDPITGDVYAELFAGEVEALRAQLEAARARLDEAPAKPRAAADAWRAFEGAPSVDLGPLLADAVRNNFTAFRAYQSVARHIREQVGGDRPVVLTIDQAALAQASYRLMLPWAVRTMKADLEAARTIDPTVETPDSLQRYEKHREEMDPRIPGTPEEATTEVINEVNRVHALNPDNPTGAPAPLPRHVPLFALDPVHLARDIAHELDADVRLDITRQDRTVDRRRVEPDGQVYAPARSDDGQAPYEPVAEQPVEDGALAKMLGPDHFGLRQAPQAPGFLRGYDFSALHAAQRAAFFDAVDLTRPAPRG